jgi:hypothetical protein
MRNVSVIDLAAHFGRHRQTVAPRKITQRIPINENKVIPVFM